jgi:hypothetical protein
MSNERKLYEGIARGGPLDGQERQSRFPRGAVVAHVPDATAWVYDWDAEKAEFVCRDDRPRRFIQSKAAEAAESSDWDVWALPGDNPMEGVEYDQPGV